MKSKPIRRSSPIQMSCAAMFATLPSASSGKADWRTISAKLGGEELDELHNVEELISSTAEFDKENPQGSLHDFLAQVSLVATPII